MSYLEQLQSATLERRSRLGLVSPPLRMLGPLPPPSIPSDVIGAVITRELRSPQFRIRPSRVKPILSAPQSFTDSDFDFGTPPWAKRVIAAVARFYGVSVADLRFHAKPKKLSKPRYIAYYILRQQRPEISYPQIGRWFNGRDHSSVFYGTRKIASRLSDYAADIAAIEAELAR